MPDLLWKLAYSVKEVTHLVPISRATIFRLIAERKLRAVKVGRRTWIPADEVRRLLQEGARRIAA